MSKWAPHTCTGTHSDGDPCGSPAYIGFGVPPKCTLRGCPHYDKQTAVEYAIELEREREGEKTPVIKKKTPEQEQLDKMYQEYEQHIKYLFAGFK